MTQKLQLNSSYEINCWQKTLLAILKLKAFEFKFGNFIMMKKID